MCTHACSKFLTRLSADDGVTDCRRARFAAAFGVPERSVSLGRRWAGLQLWWLSGARLVAQRMHLLAHNALQCP
eukprot:COSAG02_NODE_35476_length_467_cov_8.035326_1_plen_73_part_10